MRAMISLKDSEMLYQPKKRLFMAQVCYRQQLKLPNAAGNWSRSWAPMCPALSPCDFYLWVSLKAEVYKTHTRTMEQLRNSTRREISIFGEELP